MGSFVDSLPVQEPERIFSKRRRSRTPPRGTRRHDRSQSPGSWGSSDENEPTQRKYEQKRKYSPKLPNISSNAPPMPVYRSNTKQKSRDLPSSKILVGTPESHSDKILTKLLKAYDSQCSSTILDCSIV